jgi:DNA primase
VHEAKPYLQKLAAPVLRVQLTKAVAKAAYMTQAEVEAQCGIKPPTRERPPPPRPRQRTVALTLEHALLEPVLYMPERAARIPLERVPKGNREGALIHAIADAIDHGDMPRGVVGMFEFFRGTPHEATLGALMPMLAQAEPDPAELEAVFVGALERLHEKDLSREIAALNEKTGAGSISAAEELRTLLALKAKSQKTQSSE